MSFYPNIAESNMIPIVACDNGLRKIKFLSMNVLSEKNEAKEREERRERRGERRERERERRGAQSFKRASSTSQSKVC